MNWISEEDQKEGRKKFLNSIFYPIWVWFIVICIVLGFSHMIITYPENSRNSNYLEVFKNTISIVPLLFNFKVSIITSFATLILALFLNFRNENENSWKSPEEFIRKFSYKLYVEMIVNFLGVIWFILFLCKVLNIEDGFMQEDFKIDPEIPPWVFLFLSWFVLSILNYIKNEDFSAHDRIMSSYRNVIKVEGGDKNLHRVSDYIYKLYLQKGKKSKKSKNLNHYNKILKDIVLGAKERDRLPSQLDYNSWVKDVVKENNKLIMNRNAMGIIFVAAGGIFQFLILWGIGGFVYGVELRLDNKSILPWLGAICYGIVFSFYYSAALHNSVLNWCIFSRIYPRGFKTITHFGAVIILVFSLLYAHFLIIIALINSSTFSYSANWLVDIVIFIAFIIIPIIEVWFYLNKVTKAFVDINNNAAKNINYCIDIFNKDSRSTKKMKKIKKLNDKSSDLNVFKIAFSVYLQLESRKSYEEYMRFSGKSTKNLDKDLKKAYKLAKKNVK